MVWGVLCAAAQAATTEGLVLRAVPNPTNWSVRIPATEAVVFHGMLNASGKEGSAGGMLYPAADASMMLVSVLTHALISNVSQSSQQSKAQDEADKVLVPYGPTLEKLNLTKVVQQGLEKARLGGVKKIFGATEQAPMGTWVLESTPVFTLTQDERAVVLDNTIVVWSPDSPPELIYKTVVRVVSHPITAGDKDSPLSTRWTAEADGTSVLQKEITGLWAESLDVVLAELAKAPSATEVAQKTIRYPEGGAMRIERATPLQERCDRWIFKSLRGWLLSVPKKAETIDAATCDLKTATFKP